MADRPGEDDRLETARVRFVYGFGIGILVFVAASVTGFDSHIDIGVFGTLVGGFLALLGLGSVIRIVSGK